MKVREFIDRYKIILFLSFLVVVLIILKLKYGNSSENINQKIIPTPTSIPTVTQNKQYIEETIDGSE